MAQVPPAIRRLIVDTLGRFEQIDATKTALVGSSAHSSDTARLLIEFHGPRVDDTRSLQADVSRALTEAGVSIEVEFVRAGWLPAARRRVDRARAERKYRRMAGVRGSSELLDGSFSVLSEARKDAFRYFGSSSKIRTPVEISYPGRVSIGNWVSLGRYGKIVMLPAEACAGGERLVAQHYPHLAGTFDFASAAAGREANLYLGDGTTLGDHYFIICTRAVEFGKHVMTASNLFVSDCHHIYDHEIPPVLLPPSPGRPVRIEDHVWIGINCCILEGVTVGRHAVIAANSVVKDDVPPYTLVAGAPARVRKHLRP
ncbi:MAG TPA: acyltransferase [Vicinamibacterales bacterium]|nr:acyltransferase [Vicinamibacterales bacterium]